MISRILSGIVAIIYLAIAYGGGGGAGVIKCAMFLILPLACIWFSEEMGSFTGVMGRSYIDTQSPGCLVAFGGWLVLMLPVIAGIIYCFSSQ